MAYENNGQTNAGLYEVTATVSQENYNDLVLTAELNIEKAEAIITTAAVQSFIYDGELKEVSAALNHSETSLVYSPQQGYVNAGTYEVTISAAETANYLGASEEVSFLTSFFFSEEGLAEPAPLRTAETSVPSGPMTASTLSTGAVSPS